MARVEDYISVYCKSGAMCIAVSKRRETTGCSVVERLSVERDAPGISERLRYLGVGGAADAELFHARFERRWFEIEYLRGTAPSANTPARLIQDTQDVLPIDFRKRHRGKRLPFVRSGNRDAEDVIPGKNHSSLDHISKLPDVPRPGVLAKRCHRPLGDAIDPLSHAPGELLHEGPHEGWHVLTSLSERWYTDGKNVERLLGKNYTELNP